MTRAIVSGLAFFTMTFTISAGVPQTAEEVWRGYDATKAPLKVEVVGEWDKGNGHFKLVRYSVGLLKGTNKTAEPMIAAYYGAPKGRKALPGIVQIHGGGQRASKSRVEYWVKMGYAAISINWGGKVLEKPDTPNTDWDGLAAGFIGNKDQKHHNTIDPGPNTLYKEVHPLNSSWMLIAMAGRRALTFLRKQPEVDGSRRGVEGHSMGGRSTVIVAIDPRVKAASPSVGGSGYLYEDLWGLKGSKRHMRDNLEHYKRTISCQHYWAMIKCPTLFLGATNDFNSPTESVVRGMSNLPKSTDRRLVLAPHLNHRFTTSCDVARILWMEAQLKGCVVFPKTSKTELILKTQDGRPVFKVWPDVSPQNKLKAVDVYYGYARDPRIRFWRDGMAKKVDDHYEAMCPVFDTNEPLFVFANVTYRTGRVIPMPRGHRPTDEVTVSTKYWMAYPEQLKEAGVKATETRHRLIDDFSRGWHDWYRLSWSHSDHWYAGTRKVLDPSWMGPKGGKLSVELSTDGAGNRLAVIAEVNTWQGYTGRRKDTFHALVELPKKGRTSFALSVGDFKNAKGEALKDWDELTELAFTPSCKAKLPGKQPPWNGKAPVFHKVQWVGGKLIPRPYPHQVRGKAPKRGRVSFSSEFQKAIDDSVELEKQDEKSSKEDGNEEW